MDGWLIGYPSYLCKEYALSSRGIAKDLCILNKLRFLVTLGMTSLCQTHGSNNPVGMDDSVHPQGPG